MAGVYAREVRWIQVAYCTLYITKIWRLMMERDIQELIVKIYQEVMEETEKIDLEK